MTPTYIEVSDETEYISVNLVLIDPENEELSESENILTIFVTPYLTGPEARSIAERVATLASVNLSDEKPLDWGTNY